MNKTKGKMGQTERLALAAVFLSVMMVLGYVESMFPSGPVPGMKLGLANSVLLLSLYWMGIGVSFLLMIMKVFLSGILFGNPMAMQYSLAGGVLSMLMMIILIYGLRGISPVVAGIGGAVMHNVGQVGLAMIVLQTAGLLYYMGILMLVGIATGAVTGTVARLLMRYLPKWRKNQLHLGLENKEENKKSPL